MSNVERTFRATAAIVLSCSVLAGMAQEAAASPAPVSTPAFQVEASWLWALVAVAAIQAMIIASLAGIMRNLGGVGGWARRLGRGGARASMLVAGALWAARADAQAYAGGETPMSGNQAGWLLLLLNLFLFGILLVQLGLLRALAREVVGTAMAPVDAVQATAGPGWSARLLAKLTRQVKQEDEQQIEMRHDYDGIRELDNVLPPWWLWLFYGTIIWGVVYVLNVHVFNIWPDSRGQYQAEMAQAKADVEAYLATQTNTVDENTVTFADDPAMLAQGRSLFNANCTACHGADAAGTEQSVGPNLTDAYWLHGGGVKNVFHTIKYGVPEKGMIAWKAQLQPAEIKALACYILSVEGTGPATQKAPQGEQWSPEAPVAESTAAAGGGAAKADSTRVVEK
jgi:cytochrome c oxidase cbb3-type subunit 3